MLSLDSPRWTELTHAYGAAKDVPVLLRQLESFRPEPWFSLWSALAHQGDVYPASFAAVPHVIRILESDPSKADFQFFQFPAWIEICRRRKSVPIPADLETDYYYALDQIPSVAAVALSENREEGFVRGVLSAIAAATGNIDLAEAILELDSDGVSEFKDWMESR